MSGARFVAGHGAGEDGRAASTACAAMLADGLASSEIDAGHARVGLVFATDAAGSLVAIADRLREATTVETWVGTVGLGICASGVEYFDRPAVSALVATLPQGTFAPFHVPAGGEAPEYPAGHEWSDVVGPAFALLHADPRASALESAVAHVANTMATGFVVGGVASSRSEYALLAGDAPASTLSGLAFDASIGVSTRLTQGCTPIGPARRVTEGRENFIVTLDGKPALDHFRADIGEELGRDLRRVGGLIFAALPIQGSDTGDYLVRNLVGIDPESGVIAIGDHVEVGDTVMFCRRDRASAEADLVRMLDTLRAAGGEPAAAVYYSCLARGPNLFGSDSEELKLIQQHLGDVPLVGFFGNGEISHDRLYAYTGVLTVFP